ncbi:MAG: helix-hairpin-helix domain-containing protein [Cryomorphaceae bacterium]|nr:helix-hairpin-helix domain-containing protein [Cryomorphaceae bacterium]
MAAKRFLIIVLVFFSFSAAAQDEDEDVIRQQVIEQRIEAIVENLDEGADLDFTTLFDVLSTYMERPINLNQADANELRQLYLLSDAQIMNLLAHINRFGELRELFELQAVKGWDQYTIYQVLPFVTVYPPIEATKWTFKEVMKEGEHDLFLRYSRILEDQAGYAPISDAEYAENPNRRYLGSPDRIYARYRFRYKNNLSIGMTAEKDPGEEFFKGTQKRGFDFYSGHVYYEEKGWLRKFVVGDFQAQFGQGLTLWSGLGFGKSPFIASVKRNGLGIRPYTAVGENLFLRGGAITLGKGKTELTVLYSNKLIDANVTQIDSTDTEIRVSISSFQQSGLHRTLNELADRKVIREQQMGGNLSYRSRKLTIGATYMASQWGAELDRNLQIYNQFEFNSNRNAVGGVNYNLIVRNMNFFGETAMSQNGGWATLNGVLMALDQRLTVAIVNRNFQRNYQNLYANVFAERSSPTNEKGTYIAIDFKPVRKWTITGYADYFTFPWLSYQADQPTSGYEYLAQLSHKPNKTSEYYVRWRFRSKDKNSPQTDQPIDYTNPWTQENFRIHFSYKPHLNLQLKTRAEWIRYQHEGQAAEKGFMLYQDVLFKKIGSPFTFSMRYALFNTDSYNSRLYAYENDVLYFFSIPAYSGTGSRVYAMTKWHLRRGVDLWVRYARWLYTDRNSVNSGLEAIDGNARSEIRVQLRVRL